MANDTPSGGQTTTTGSGSAAGNSPNTATGLPGGVMAGNGGCVLELVTDAGGISKWNFRHENQLGSLIGMTDMAADRVAEVDYGAPSRKLRFHSGTFAARTGQTYLKPPGTRQCLVPETFASRTCWDGAVDVANTQNVAADITRVYAQFGVGIPLDAVNGLVRCVHPGAAEHVSFGTVLNVGFDGGLNQSYMDVEDLEGRVLDAIKEIGCDLTVLCNYGNVAPPTQPVTSGHWDDVVYDSFTDTTTFTDNSGTFPAHAIDWWVQPDAGRSTYLDIVNISASEIVVAGDATGLAHGLIQQPLPDPDILGTFYTIVWPVGVDPATGTLAHNDPCNPASRLLFAGNYYMPPVAGTTVPPSAGAPGTYGKQPGGNYTGNYYCWNRILSPTTGRWTTPDPAASPSSNLQDYVGSNPLRGIDPSGLFGWTEHPSITARALRLTNVPTCLREQVLRGSQRIDWTHADVRAFHVDDTRMLGDTEAWLKAVKAAGEHIREQNGKASCECLASLARIAGMGAHTIQDFYHHTDWFFGAGGDIRSSQNALIGLVRWDETKKGAKAVRTGSGWVFYGAYEGQRRAEARTGEWHHDPWSGSKGPQPPLGYDKEGYLQKAISDVVVPHTGTFLQEVIGNMNVGCCCPNGELKSSPGTLTDSSHLTECFGDAAKDLIKYLAVRHTSNTQLEK